MGEPLPICHLDGAWMPLAEARVSPLDRGFLFGDGVYEVVPVFQGRPFRFVEHFDRLARSATALRIPDPHSRDEWRALVRELMARNGGGDLYVYVQLTRGAEYGRNHAPPANLKPTVFAFAAPMPTLSDRQRREGFTCITTDDLRWARCDIKSVALLGNVMARHDAALQGADEAILLKAGQLREATASTVHVVKDGVILTPPNSNEILPSTTRTVVEEIADRLALPCRTRVISEKELRTADEIWLSAATRNVSPVTRLDGQPVGSGRPGPVWERVARGFEDLQRELAGTPW